MKMSVIHNNIAPSLHQQVQYADLFKGYWIDNWHGKSLIDRLIKIPLCHFEPEMMIIQRTSLRLSFFTCESIQFVFHDTHRFNEYS